MMIQRDKDMYLGNRDLEHLYTMSRFPVYCGTTNGKESEDQYEDMEWMISRGSGMIQLGKLLPPEILYSVSHNSSYGGIWRRHHEEFAEFLHRYTGTKGILEIGGGNGILCSVYNAMESTGGVRWTIIEPSNVKIAAGCNAYYIKKMWNHELDLRDIPYDTLVHSHLIEHQYDLNDFMMTCAKALELGERMVFALPNLKHWLKEKFLNTLFFEHTYLISDDYVESILHKYRFRILERRDFGNGHSLFYAAEKMHDSMTAEPDYGRFYADNKRDFLDFIAYFKDKVAQYNESMKACDHVYLFGAHIFSQMLIHFGLRTDKVRCILDNDPLKQGKRLYGTSFRVKSPEILTNEDKPIIVLNAGAYSGEIKDDIVKRINSKTTFLE